LRELGEQAFAVLLPLLHDARQAWVAAKIMADVGRPDPAVVEALVAAMIRLDGPGRLWAARALGRLGHLDRVLREAGRVPPDVVVAAAVAPYRSFRDHGTRVLLLDYRPLAAVLERHPELADALFEELAPGRGHCTIGADEVAEAVRGLASPHPVIRRHAAAVLGRTSGGATSEA
jgi:HEAT repeat protein